MGFQTLQIYSNALPEFEPLFLPNVDLEQQCWVICYCSAFLSFVSITIFPFEVIYFHLWCAKKASLHNYDNELILNKSRINWCRCTWFSIEYQSVKLFVFIIINVASTCCSTSSQPMRRFESQFFLCRIHSSKLSLSRILSDIKLPIIEYQVTELYVSK